MHMYRQEWHTESKGALLYARLCSTFSTLHERG